MDELLSSPDVPQDAKLIVLILKSMGVTQYDPAVVVQLLEFTHRKWKSKLEGFDGCLTKKKKKKKGYAVEVLSDAMQYAAHTDSKASIDIGDLKMAIQARVNTSFTPAPSREVTTYQFFVHSSNFFFFNARFYIRLLAPRMRCHFHCRHVVPARSCLCQRCDWRRPIGNSVPSSRHKRHIRHCLQPTMLLHTLQRSRKQSRSISRHTKSKSLRQAWQNNNKNTRIFGSECK